MEKYEENQMQVISSLVSKNLVPSVQETTLKSTVFIIFIMVLPFFTVIFLLPAFAYPYNLMMVLPIAACEVLLLAYIEKVRLSNYVTGVLILDGIYYFADVELSLRYRVAKYYTVVLPEKPITDLSSDFSEEEIKDTIRKFNSLKTVIVGDDYKAISGVMSKKEAESEEMRLVRERLSKNLPEGVSLEVIERPLGDTVEYLTCFKFGRYYMERVECLDGTTFFIVSVAPFSEMIKPKRQLIDAQEWYAKASVGFGVFRFIDSDIDPETGNPVGIYYLVFSDYFIRTASILSPSMFKQVKPEEASLYKSATDLSYSIVYKKRLDETEKYARSLEEALERIDSDAVSRAESMLDKLFYTYLFGKSGYSGSTKLLLDKFKSEQGIIEQKEGLLSRIWKPLLVILGVVAVLGIFFGFILPIIGGLI